MDWLIFSLIYFALKLCRHVYSWKEQRGKKSQKLPQEKPLLKAISLLTDGRISWKSSTIFTKSNPFSKPEKCYLILSPVCLCFGINRCLMRNVSTMVFEEPGWILVLIQYLILTKLITFTAEPIVLAFKPTDIPTLADWQKCSFKCSFCQNRAEIKKKKNPEVSNDLTCILHFLFYLYNTQKCSERKGKRSWITCRLDSYHNQFLYVFHWVL